MGFSPPNLSLHTPCIPVSQGHPITFMATSNERKPSPGTPHDPSPHTAAMCCFTSCGRSHFPSALSFASRKSIGIQASLLDVKSPLLVLCSLLQCWTAWVHVLCLHIYCMYMNVGHTPWPRVSCWEGISPAAESVFLEAGRIDMGRVSV